MNLLDIVELSKKEAPVAEVQRIKVKSKHLQRFLDGMATAGPIRNHYTTLQIEGSGLREIDKMKKEVILKHGTFGELLESPLGDKKLDLWDRLSETPKMEVAKLRKICDSLGFVIVPFDYLDPLSYAGESAELKKGIKEFATQKDFQAYVLCPVPHYSFDRHIRSIDMNKPIYSGRHSQIFMSLQMSMPFLRTVFKDIRALKGQVKIANARLSFAEENIKMISQALEDLQRQVEFQQKEMAIMRATIFQQRKEMEEMEARILCALDPLMFIVEEGIDIKNGNGIAFIGPCWGPDFDEIVLMAIDLDKIEGQRSYIEGAIKRLWFK